MGPERLKLIIPVLLIVDHNKVTVNSLLFLGAKLKCIIADPDIAGFPGV